MYDGEVRKQSPVLVGFHCPGSCWHDAGGTAGLFAWLESRGYEARDWFVQASWTEEEPSLIPLPPISDIHPIQDYLVASVVEKYRRSNIPVDGDREAWELHPTLFTWDDKVYVFQGTHRLAAAYMNGAGSFLGWHVDLSSL